MCGRYTLRTPIKAVAEAFDLPLDSTERIRQQPLRFNIAPTQEVAAIRWNTERNARELAWFDWGLVPHWADDPAIGSRLVNARAESVATKPAFRSALRHRRCLVAADGFYEWKRRDGRKQPHYIRLKEDGPFAFAGLWECWNKADVTIESCTIITTEANSLLQPLHSRMPVIIDPDQVELWLDPTVEDPERLKPYPAEKMIAFPVSTLVNNPRHDTPQCIEPSVPEKLQKSLFD